MKVVLLAGGLGTRLSEETVIKPKPMVDIGNFPILWHIMKIYSFYGYNEFVICLGYKGYIIKEYFANYYRHQANITIDLSNDKMIVHKSQAEPWKITLIETGNEAQTGARIHRVKEYLDNKPFLLTYGDGVADININALIEAHKQSGKLLTVTAVQPTGRFGALQLKDDNTVQSFLEKPKGDGVWINGGFFVCEPGIFDYLSDDDLLVWEKSPMEQIAYNEQMNAYRHEGFWKPMDTLRDKAELELLWNTGKAPWKLWK